MIESFTPQQASDGEKSPAYTERTRFNNHLNVEKCSKM